MSSQFYKTIIDDEISSFGIKIDTLKVAASSVQKSYNPKSLQEGNTFVDYNVPSNRCAYLYKYAPIHTSLVTKYFRTLLQKKQIKSTLKGREKLKICCLGGGPGNDIVGLFRALALNPSYHKKVVEITVLDICGGWRNSFKRIIGSLVDGKLKDVPAKFFDAANFKFKLLEVDLLKKLPANIVTILSEADIVCMVKFVSAILGSTASFSAIEAIGKLWKVGAVIFFIDNFNGNVFKPLIETADQEGLKIIIGPLHINFNPKTGFRNPPKITAAEKETYGYLPCYNTKVTVLSFLKTDILCDESLLNEAAVTSEIDTDNGDGWDTDSEEIINAHVSTQEHTSKITVPKKSKKRSRRKKKKSTDNVSEAKKASLKKNKQLLKSEQNLAKPNSNHSQKAILPKKVAKDNRKITKDNKLEIDKTTQSQETSDNLQMLMNAYSNMDKNLSQSSNSSMEYSKDFSKLYVDSSKNILQVPQSTVITKPNENIPNLNVNSQINTAKSLSESTNSFTKFSEDSKLSLDSPQKNLQVPQSTVITKSNENLPNLNVNSEINIAKSLSQSTNSLTKFSENFSKLSLDSPQKNLQVPQATVLMKPFENLPNLNVNLPKKVSQLLQETKGLAKSSDNLSELNIHSPKKKSKASKAIKFLTKTTTNLQNSTEVISKATCEKYTQTYEKFECKAESIDTQANGSTSIRELNKLVDSLSALVDVFAQWQQKRMQKTHCEFCHCHC